LCLVVLLTDIEEIVPDDGLKTAETCRLINYMLYVACDCTVKKYALINVGTHGGEVVKALRHKPAGRGFVSRWCQWNVFSDIIIPVALWPWGRLSL
jgi:hypothetical protein